VNLQPAPAIVVNEAHLSEPVHEKADPRTGWTYRVCKGLLTDLGDYSLGDAFLPEVSKPQQNPSQSLFAGIKKLSRPVDQVFFVANVSRQKIGHEHNRKGRVWSADHVDVCSQSLPLTRSSAVISNRGDKAYASRRIGKTGNG